MKSNEPPNYFTGSLENVSVSKLLQSNYFGKVLSYNGQVIEATPLPGIIGSLCSIFARSNEEFQGELVGCLLYTSPSPRDRQKSRMPSSA